MRRFSVLIAEFLMVVALTGGVSFSVLAQDQDAASKDAQQRKDALANEVKGLPPRAAPSEYQAQARAGVVTIAAEFMGHSVPTPEAIYSNEDFVVVEVGVFGPPEARTTLSTGDFSLRINGRKIALTSQPYELAFKSLKDPEWEPPNKSESKSKTSIGDGGGGTGDSAPAPVHMPIELKRAMEQRVRRSKMLEGDRPLPQAGLLFFEYRGKTQNIRSIELIYSGPAGSASLALQP